VVFKSLFSTRALVTPFQEWAATANAQRLIRATQVLSAEGGQWVVGRSRGGESVPALGWRRRPEAGYGGLQGFAGAADLTERISKSLSCNYTEIGSTRPRRCQCWRSGYRTGSGDLVHSIFQWIGESEKSTTYSLRRDWSDRSASPRQRLRAA
jgi:hypothetical protein